MPDKQTPTARFHRDIIVIGASAGGVEALLTLVAGLPETDASFFVVLHTRRKAFSKLPTLLGRASEHLKVVPARDGLAIEPGRMYVALPDYHLLVERGHMRLVRKPMENHHRPAIDPLFRSAARAYGPRVISVVLSGYLDDGSAGVHAVKRAGGLAVVQNPDDALVPSMPESAIGTTHIDYVAPIDQMAALLDRLVQQEFELGADVMGAQGEHEQEEIVDPKGQPSGYTCPECYGTLWEVQEGNLLRYACRLGHPYSAESMLQDQSDSAERALWAALRALEERRDLAQRMAQRSSKSGFHKSANRYHEQATSATRDADVLRKLLLENRPPSFRERHHALAKSAVKKR